MVSGCNVVVRFGFGGENSAEGGRCFLKRGTRFKKRGGGDASMLGSASLLAVCHNSQSASLLSNSGLVIYFKLRRRRSLFLEAWHTLQEERRADASTPGSASRQGAWLTPRRAKATESPPRRADERRVTFCVVLQTGRSWKGRAGQRRIGEERFPAVVPCSPRW